MEVKVATDVGLARKHNEDAFWVGSNCFVVCDGMGGHSAGEVASALAVQAVQEYEFLNGDLSSQIREVIGYAQARILATAEENSNYTGMGTTITLAYLSPLAEGGAELVIGHVGDSRAYLFGEAGLEQLTTDHSVVMEMVRAGTITAREARSHSKRHVLTQALGTSEIAVEITTKTLPKGALLLLCTDGLTDVVEDDNIARTLARFSQLENAAQSLVELANQGGGPDNITAIVIKVP